MNIVTLERSYELLETFQCDIMILYISALGYAMRLKFNSYVYLPSGNQKVFF